MIICNVMLIEDFLPVNAYVTLSCDERTAAPAQLQVVYQAFNVLTAFNIYLSSLKFLLRHSGFKVSRLAPVKNLTMLSLFRVSELMSRLKDAF